MAYGRFGLLVNIPHDPFASTVDTIQAYYHIQSISKSGAYPDLTAPAAANYPESGGATRYFLELRQRFDVSDLSASRPATITDETTATDLTRVTAAPSNNQYRTAPSSSIRRSVIEIHSGQAGHTISYDFYGIGSVIDEDVAETFNKFEYNRKNVTADYTITDIDGFRDFHCTLDSVGDVTITLPTVADNEDRTLHFYKDSDYGRLKIDGEGAEKIEDVASEYLFSKWDHLTIRSDGTQWVIISMYSSIDTGWISNSDYQNQHLGTVELDYDNLSGTFTLGERVTGGTSNHYGILMKDTGSTLTFRNIVLDSANVFQDNEQLTGSISGATADVDEAAGAANGAKDLDRNYYHSTAIGTALLDYELIIYISTDGTDANSFDPKIGADSGADCGYSIYPVDTNYLQLQTQGNGIGYITTAGSIGRVDSEDWYYKIIWLRRR